MQHEKLFSFRKGFLTFGADLRDAVNCFQAHAGLFMFQFIRAGGQIIKSRARYNDIGIKAIGICDLMPAACSRPSIGRIIGGKSLPKAENIAILSRKACESTGQRPDRRKRPQ